MTKERSKCLPKWQTLKKLCMVNSRTQLIKKRIKRVVVLFLDLDTFVGLTLVNSNPIIISHEAKSLLAEAKILTRHGV